MKEFLRTAGILALVCFVAGLLLAVTAKLTKEPIDNTNAMRKEAARSMVLPAAKYVVLREKSLSNLEAMLPEIARTDAMTFHPVRSTIGTNIVQAFDDKGRCIGYIFDVRSPEGYGGNMSIIVGVAVRSNAHWGHPVISDYLVITSAETPGLGKAVEVSMHAVFTNAALASRKGLAEINPRDRKTDCVSGATVTSVAIKDALYAALRLSTALLKRDFVNLAIPEREMAIVPYAQTYVPLALVAADPALRSALEVKYYDQTSGYLFKIYMRDEKSGAKYLALAGITSSDGKLYTTRLYTMPASTNVPFVPVDFRREFFGGVEIATLATNAALAGLEKDLARAIVSGQDMLRKAGKLK